MRRGQWCFRLVFQAMMQVTETCLPAGQPERAGFRDGAEQKGQVAVSTTEPGFMTRPGG